MVCIIRRNCSCCNSVQWTIGTALRSMERLWSDDRGFALEPRSTRLAPAGSPPWSRLPAGPRLHRRNHVTGRKWRQREVIRRSWGHWWGRWWPGGRKTNYSISSTFSLKQEVTSTQSADLLVLWAASIVSLTFARWSRGRSRSRITQSLGGRCAWPPSDWRRSLSERYVRQSVE